MADLVRKWITFEAIIDNGDLTQSETLVALGLLRHANDDLAEAAPGNAVLLHHARLKKPHAISAAIRGLKAKGIVRNRHAGFHARVFTFQDAITEAVIQFRERVP